MFGPKRDEVKGEWRNLHEEVLRDLSSLPNNVRVVKSRRMRWARLRWEDNIKMNLQEVGGVETGWGWLRIGTGGGHL